MGLLLFAGMLSFLVGGLTFVAVNHFVCPRISNARWRNNLQLALLIGAICVSGIVFQPVAQWLWESMTTTGHNVTVDEVRAVGPKLPASAANVNYIANYGGCSAQFQISERDYQAWTAEQDWSVQPIESPRRIDVPPLELQLKVTDGLFTDGQFASNGSGVYMTFDRSTSTCYYRYSSY